MKKLIRIGLIGYGFMGHTHLNAYSRLSHFFDTEHVQVRQAVCGRDEAKVTAVEKSGLPNLVWYNYRFLLAVTHAKNIVAAGELGRIFHYRANFL